MQELWQLFDELGQPIDGKGSSKDDIFQKGLLHGASHVWIWAKNENGINVLLQRRGEHKKTWPGLFDISAAGHIDLNETPLSAALRETKEELGLDVSEKDLKLINIFRAHLRTDNGLTENEFQWIYLVKLQAMDSFKPINSELSSIEWVSLDNFKFETTGKQDKFVPHGSQYFNIVISGIEDAAKNSL